MLQLRHLFLNEEKCAVSSRDKGTFNEYMEKKRWVGGPKRGFFPGSGLKNVQVEVGRWSIKGAILST